MAAQALQATDQHAQTSRVEEVNALQVDHDLVLTLAHELDELLAQAWSGVYVYLPSHSQHNVGLATFVYLETEIHRAKTLPSRLLVRAPATLAAISQERPRQAAGAWQTPVVATRSAAFFDLDRTVIAKASIVAFSGPFYREGLLTRRLVVHALWRQALFARFGAPQTTIDRLRVLVQRLTEGWEQERVRSVVTRTLAQVAGPITYTEALDLITEHKSAGRRVYIVSASPAEIVEPLARYLGAEEAIATRAAVRAGRYTGQLLRYAFGPEKAAAMREAAERDDLDLAESWAYSDSATDLPMLEAVGNPVAVNPDRALRRIARMRGWPVLEFSQLAVMTPSGRRPPRSFRSGLVGATGAVVLAALALSVAVVVKRRPASAL